MNVYGSVYVCVCVHMCVHVYVCVLVFLPAMDMTIQDRVV